jgi:hypothetical protein
MRQAWELQKWKDRSHFERYAMAVVYARNALG